MAALNHPNIAHLHDLRESDGVQFLAMDLVGGTTLADRLEKVPVLIQMCATIGLRDAES